MRIPILVLFVISNALAFNAFAKSNHKNTLGKGAYQSPEDGLKGPIDMTGKVGKAGDERGDDAISVTTTDPAAKGKDDLANGSAQTGQGVVSFNDGNRPMFLDAKSPVGPEQTLTTAQGAPVCAADIVNGTVPVGTQLIMTSSVTGQAVPCTVVSSGDTGTLVSQSVNPKFPDITMDASRGGAGTQNIFGCQPLTNTALEVVGITNVADIVYYNIKAEDRPLLEQGGVKFGPGTYLLAATGASATQTATAVNDFDARRNDIAQANLRGDAVGKAFKARSRGIASQESKMRLDYGPSSTGKVAALAAEPKGNPTRDCKANIVGGGGGGGGGGANQSQAQGTVQLGTQAPAGNGGA